MRLILAKLQQAASTFWMMREARERRLLLIAAAFIIATLYYLLLVAPAISARELHNKDLPQLREQVAQMQALSGEAASLSSLAPGTIPAMSSETLTTSLAAHGLKAGSINVIGETAQLQLSGASFSNTLGWLQDLQLSSRISVSATKITPLAKPDQVDASFTLHQTLP